MFLQTAPGFSISLDALLKIIQLAVAMTVLVGGLVEFWTGAVRNRLKRVDEIPSLRKQYNNTQADLEDARQAFEERYEEAQSDQEDLENAVLALGMALDEDGSVDMVKLRRHLGVDTFPHDLLGAPDEDDER